MQPVTFPPPPPPTAACGLHRSVRTRADVCSCCRPRDDAPDPRARVAPCRPGPLPPRHVLLRLCRADTDPPAHAARSRGAGCGDGRLPAARAVGDGRADVGPARQHAARGESRTRARICARTHARTQTRLYTHAHTQLVREVALLGDDGRALGFLEYAMGEVQHAHTHYSPALVDLGPTHTYAARAHTCTCTCTLSHTHTLQRVCDLGCASAARQWHERALSPR